MAVVGSPLVPAHGVEFAGLGRFPRLHDGLRCGIVICLR